MLANIPYALRTLRKSPAFTAIAVLTLAIGMGAVTSMFSVIHAVLLEPLPYADADRLMVITERDRKRNVVQHYSLSYVNFQDWRAVQNSFDELALFRAPYSYRLTGRERSFISTRMVSGNFLSMLGVTPVVGRILTPDDDRAGAEPVVVLSYAGWQRLFGAQRINRVFTVGQPTALNEKLNFNGVTYSVIGVLPREFRFYTADSNQNADAYIPISLTRQTWTTDRARRPGISALGRLKAGATQPGAQAQLDAVAQQLEILYPAENEHRGAAVQPMFEAIVDEELRRTLYLLTGAVALMLLIACANVANLLLTRGASRHKEIAIRCALGGRWQVVRQLVTESVVLTAAGGAAGLIVAIAGTDLLVIAAPTRLPRLEMVGMDWQVLLFAFGISVLTGIAFGIVPALQTLRADIQSDLKEGGASSVRSRLLPQRLLIAGEIALALVLLLAGGLVFRSTQKALSVDPGFDPANLWAFGIVISPETYETGAEIRSFFRNVETRLAALPEVRGSSVILGGLPKPIGVHEGFLPMMGIRLLRGRFFDSRDTLNSPAVIVIDENLARNRFGAEDPIGKSFIIDLPGTRTINLDRPHEVIGVVSHIQRLGIEADDQSQLQSQFYLSIEQLPDDLLESAAPRMLIKSAWPEEKALQSLEAAVQKVDRTALVSGLTRMKDAVERALVPRQFVTRLFGVFASVGFVLAGLGIFGLMTYSVSLRTQEIGIRMALGAESRHVVKSVVGQAAVISAAGIVLGLVASVWLTRFVDYLLFDMTANDPVTYAFAVVLLFAVALLAAYIPAARATRLQPVVALRGGSVDSPQIRRTILPSAPRNEDSSIEVSNLQKTYSTFRGKPFAALSSVSFTVGPGMIFGLIGQNGAGKTTLVKILLGLTRASAGTARVLGCAPGDPIANRRIGYLPEHMRIPGHYTAATFMRYMGNLNGMDEDILELRIPLLLDKVGLAGVQKPVRSFSKGMLQRLGLAQAMLNDPELLILDEPTDGLDPLGRIFVRDLLLQLRASGKTIFLNSHLLSEIELVCDRIIILDKGAVACTTTPADFTRGTGEYAVRLDTSSGALPAEARRRVDAVIGSAIWEEGALRFTPANPAHLNEILDELRRLRITILSVEPVRITLEQYFIQVVTKES